MRDPLHTREFERRADASRAALARGDFEAALDLAGEAAEAAADDRDLRGVLRIRWDALMASGDRAGARAAGLHGLRLAELEGDLDSEDLLWFHNSLGIVGKFTGNFDEAMRHYAAALEILDRTGERSGDRRAVLEHNLGGLAHSRGEYETARVHTARAVELHLDVHGPEHPSTLADRGQLGSILSELGRHDEAIELLADVIDGMSEALGADHLEVAIARTTLGCALARADRHDEALECYLRGLEDRERIQGPGHPELAPTLINLGQHYAEVGDVPRARGYVRRAVDVLEAGQATDDHPFLVFARERLVELDGEA